jgi:uncharacterized protein YecT (DUF1311 family)
MPNSGLGGNWPGWGRLAVLAALSLAVLQAHPANGGEAPELCAATQSSVERLICGEPSLAELDAAMARALLDYQDRAASAAERKAQIAHQLSWLAGREPACPAVTPPQPGAPLQAAAREIAVACLSRIYEHRVAVLLHERNLAAWPIVRFRPRIVEGKGIKLCEDLGRDLAVSFFGRSVFVDPLGEREIGFAPLPALGDQPLVLRADIDAYNRGKPFPVLQWIAGYHEPQLPVVEYRAYDSPAQLLAAIGRGGEPLARNVRAAGHPVFKDMIPTVDDMPRFFRHDGRVYLLASTGPVSGRPGDLGAYRLYGPGRLHRVCLFNSHRPGAHVTDDPLSLSEVKALERAAGPLLPTGTLCATAGNQGHSVLDHAASRPWVLERTRSPRTLDGNRLDLYMRNRGLTGPERARQYRDYLAARAAAIEAVAPFYRNRFGRKPAEAKRTAALFLDSLVSDGFQVDPDDESIAMLFAPDYTKRHAAQAAALAGDTAGLIEALGPEPKAVAKGVKGDLDEPLVTNALEHPETLRALLDMGLDPDETGASGRTPLMVAGRLDLVAAAAILLAHGAFADKGASEAVAQTDGADDAPCMPAGQAASDTPGRTALSYAAELGSTDMVRLLLDRGAAAKPDSAGRHPADYVKRRTGDPGHSAIIAEMLK